MIFNTGDGENIEHIWDELDRICNCSFILFWVNITQKSFSDVFITIPNYLISIHVILISSIVRMFSSEMKYMLYQCKEDNANTSVEPPIFYFIRYLEKSILVLMNYKVTLVVGAIFQNMHLIYTIIEEAKNMICSR